jgi:hypothetical protein
VPGRANTTETLADITSLSAVAGRNLLLARYCVASTILLNGMPARSLWTRTASADGPS